MGDDALRGSFEERSASRKLRGTMRFEEASRNDALRGSFEERCAARKLRGTMRFEEERCASRNTGIGARASRKRSPSYSPDDLLMTPDDRSSVSKTFAILFAAMVADAEARKEPMAEDGRGGISPSPEAGRGGGEIEPRALISAEALRDTSISSSRAIRYESNVCSSVTSRTTGRNSGKHSSQSRDSASTSRMATCLAPLNALSSQ